MERGSLGALAAKGLVPGLKGGSRTVDISIILQLTIGGLAMGTIYGLIALGMNLIYNATGGLNYAQGSLVMISAYVSLSFSRWFTGIGHSMILAALCAIPTMGIVGAIFGRLLYEPIRMEKSSRFTLVALAAGILISETAPHIWGKLPHMLPRFISKASIRAGSLVFNTQSLLTIGVVSVSLIVLQTLLNKTQWGLMMRAVGQSKEVSSLMGIPVRRSIRLTFAASTMLAAIAGIMAGPIFYVSPLLLDLSTKGFAAAVLGGFSPRVSGALLAGVLIGLVETYSAFFLSSAYRDAWGFFFLICFLFVRPVGIFGEQHATKV